MNRNPQQFLRPLSWEGWASAEAGPRSGGWAPTLSPGAGDAAGGAREGGVAVASRGWGKRAEQRQQVGASTWLPFLLRPVWALWAHPQKHPGRGVLGNTVQPHQAATSPSLQASWATETYLCDREREDLIFAGRGCSNQIIGPSSSCLFSKTKGYRLQLKLANISWVLVMCQALGWASPM